LFDDEKTTSNEVMARAHLLPLSAALASAFLKRGPKPETQKKIILCGVRASWKSQGLP